MKFSSAIIVASAAAAFSAPVTQETPRDLVSSIADTVKNGIALDNGDQSAGPQLASSIFGIVRGALTGGLL
ncbi:hypothetical protein HIM_02466 [Hirsutella minnesotensis 3608]|nr:hypothetical protein HIM_02466 [Hirsutella minnesotensis 3608]